MRTVCYCSIRNLLLAMFCVQLCQELSEFRSPDGAAVLHSIISSCSSHLAGASTTTAGRADGATTASSGTGGSGWIRGAVEVLGQLCPAVGSYQGSQVALCDNVLRRCAPNYASTMCFIWVLQRQPSIMR